MNISMEKISFSYGSNRILFDVDFTVRAGEIRALLGENGAGKSTLMNLLGGVLRTDSGKIFIDGKPVQFANPAASLDAGIGFIHQELNLIDDLKVYENMFLTHLKTKGMLLDRQYMIKKTGELFCNLGIDIDPTAYVRDLDVSYKQITEICRALLQEAKVLIMDEPTTSLTDREIQRVFSIMKRLKKQGVAIIFISHKLNEVMEICDSYSVMRNGHMVEHGNISETNARGLAEKLVGHEMNSDSFVTDHEMAEDVLRLVNFSDGKAFQNITLSVKAGEVLGVTGLLGDGRAEIFESVYGARKEKITGEIQYLGKSYIPKNTSDAAKRGIAYLPRNRKENGILPDMSIVDNSAITHLEKLRRGGFIDKKRVEKAFSEQREKLGIRMKDGKNPITSLSGGNQQKVILSRLLMTKPKLLILDNPTQGVDVGAKAEIYSIIRDAADGGMAVIVLSPDAREIVGLCDRTAVLFHGRLEKILEGNEITENNIMYYATGGAHTDKSGEA